jgi:1,4-dihydroxy-2-naphthoyl-CoA hydrolase
LTADWLRIERTVRFGDTDAAGVMHFHQLLRWCHEAYEESLERFGIPPAEVFPTPRWDGTPAASTPMVALPIVHCSADFLRPLVCGDRLNIQLHPIQIEAGGFEVAYHVRRLGSDGPAEVVAQGLTCHRAIDATTRKGCELPGGISQWLEKSRPFPTAA